MKMTLPAVGFVLAPAKCRTRDLLVRRSRRGNAIVTILALVVIGVGVGGAVYWTMFRGKEDKGPGPMVKQVSQGAYESVVLEQGEIESSSNIEIRCEVKGRNGGGITILEVMPEGAQVKEGDLLVRLDSSALEQERLQQKIVVNTSEALVVQAKNTLDAALISRKEYLEGTFKQEEKLYLGEVFVAEQNLRSAQLSFDSAQRLAGKGILSPLQLEGAKYGVDNARNQLDGAQTKVEVLRKYTREKMLKQFDSDIATADAKVRAEESSNQLERDKLKDIEEQIAKCVIKATQPGQVVYANKYNSGGRSGSSAEFVVEAGSMVREQQPIIRLPDPHNMQVKALINEARVTKVRPGLPVTIRVDALKDELMQGEVIKVNQYAEPSSWSSGSVKKYAAYIKILSPPPALRTGMNAEARIHIERRPDALQVPVQALVDHKGHFFVLVQNGEKLETREVTVGSTNDKVAVIEKGLAVSDTVVLNPRREAALDLPNLPDASPVKVVAIAAAPVNAKGPGGDGESKKKGPGGFGGGAPTVASMLERTLESDQDKDGKLSAGEVENVSERMRPFLAGADKNGDGFLDRDELLPVMAARVAAIKAQSKQGGISGTGGGQ
ncbi:HlyD family efflux transporter periplasmic adaptor subunit [Anatilimnocola floriformis]|uniref:HlyD family efflux transporter periplasmic adaptor subunit n=1 Tax=Anatilimnocola floriformis TaxID=2948575 RepID=UPI0020C340DC|nr:HlyD family efflux transporter periplasmic adaptor subunit [Anatilimnocola floriformis]